MKGNEAFSFALLLLGCSAQEDFCVLPKERALCENRFYESCYEAICYGSRALCNRLAQEEQGFLGFCIATEALATLTNCNCFCEDGVSAREGAAHCYGGKGIDVTQPVSGNCEAGGVCEPESPLCELQEYFLFATFGYGDFVSETASSLDYYGDDSDCDTYDDGKSNDAIVCSNANITQDDEGRNYCDITFSGTNDGLDILRYVFAFLELQERNITFGGKKEKEKENKTSISFIALEQLAFIAFGPDEHNTIDGIVEIAYEAARSKGCFDRPGAAIHFSVHSLAAALANFFVLKLAAEEPQVYVKMTTIGEPSVLTKPLEGKAATLQAWSNKHKYINTRVLPRGEVFDTPLLNVQEREYGLHQDHDWVAQVLPGAYTAENSETQVSFLCEVKNGNFLEYFIAGPYGPGGPDEQDAPYGCAAVAGVETVDDMPYFPHRSGLSEEERHPFNQLIDGASDMLEKTGFGELADLLDFINVASTLVDADFRDDFYQIFDIHFMRRPLHLLNLLYANSAECAATRRLVAIPDEPTAPDGSNSTIWWCFSEKDTVTVKDKGIIPMNALKIGDKVMTDTGVYGTVYSFGHFAPEADAKFLEIHVAGGGEPLLISMSHMVFVDSTTAIPASKLAAGDSVLVAGRNIAKVKSINRVAGKGAYAPFTTSGTIVVNGVVTSCFVDLENDNGFLHVWGLQTPFMWHWLAVVFEAPHRLVCMQSSAFCKQETYADGISAWVAGPLHWSEWLIKQNPLVVSVIFVLLAPMFLGCYAVESVLLHPMPRLVLFALGAILAAYCFSGMKKVKRA